MPPERSPAATPSRLVSLDVLRGLVMVLMAVDHVRVFSGLPAGGPTPGIFFTRWITHFCAPAFVFLAGTGAYLHGRPLARYLVTRGCLLILLELTVNRLAWTFNLDYTHYLLAGVIWMLGVCMILLAALARLSTRTIAIFGLVVIAGHNLIPAGDSGNWLLQFLYFGGEIQFGSGPTISVLYTIVPWIGVMATGYAFGAVMVRDAAARRRWCLTAGGAAIALFLVLRWLDVYGDPQTWSEANGAPVLLRFLRTSKYPASLLFLLMTLGPLVAAVPLSERATGAVGRVLSVFGRVPLFYYLLHLPLIHAAALVVSALREGRIDPWLFTNHPMMNPEPPDGYTWPLWLLYVVFVAVVAILYFPCRWYAQVKRRGEVRWLRYL